MTTKRDIQEVLQAASDRTRQEPINPYNNQLDPDPDGLYAKYRVFREPDNVLEGDHPVGVDAVYRNEKGIEDFMEEVKEFVFVLKPDSDPHAKVALAAYAQSVSREKPLLSLDLWEVLGGM